MNRPKQVIKRTVDLAMIALLPFLMAEILIGQEIHEWLGTVMLVLFLGHHLLNTGWWKSFAKRKYTPLRAFGTALDFLLLLDMTALLVSGIMMSGFVFRFLHANGSMILARRLHLFASYWGLILMSAHLGMHMEQFFQMGRKLLCLSEKNASRTLLLRIAAAALSMYGLYAFITQRMADYLFLQTHFVMFDETKSAAVYFAETVAEMCLFAAAAHYTGRLLRRAAPKTEKERSSGRISKTVAFLTPVLVGVLVAAGLILPSQSGPRQMISTELPEEGSADTARNGAGDSGLSQPQAAADSSEANQPEDAAAPSASSGPDGQTVPVEDGFVLVHGGSLPDDIAAWLETNHI